MGGGDEGLVEEQAAFYEADAASFDRWLGELIDEANADPTAQTYRAGRSAIAEALGRRAPLGDVLEIAAGGGRLAELYAAHADRIVLVDSSRTSLDLAVARLGPRHADVTAIESDVFGWDEQGARFDTIIFCAWLHHVPHARFDQFWAKVDRLLEPEGRVLFDFPDRNRPPAGAHVDIPDEPAEDYRFYAPRDGISIRDHFGRRWQVVHHVWDPDELVQRLRGIGWTMQVLGPGLFSNIVWAEARRT